MPHKLSPSGAAGPWASLLLALSAVLLYLTPDLTAWATFDRTAIAAGQLWRLVTGHWTHWSGEHLAWDLLVFAGVGGALELRGRRRVFLTCTVLSALLISGGVWLLRPGMDEYRGLSGIDCALVTLVAVDFLRQAIRERQRALSLAVAALLAGYLGKVAFELATGQTLFVDSGPGLFVPVPLAHVLGGAVGIALGLVLDEPRVVGVVPGSLSEEASGQGRVAHEGAQHLRRLNGHMQATTPTGAGAVSEPPEASPAAPAEVREECPAGNRCADQPREGSEDRPALPWAHGGGDSAGHQPVSRLQRD